MRERLRFFARKIRPERALGFVEELSTHHRIRGSSGYDRALMFIKEQLDAHGIQNEIIEFPLDNETMYWTWKMPFAWEGHRATLALAGKIPRQICDFSREPLCLVPGSSSLKGKFQVVSVGKGTSPQDYPGDIRNKLVLATGHPFRVHRLAVVERGAAGILFDYMPAEDRDIKRTRRDLPEVHSYMGIYASAGENCAAFALTHNQARVIRRRLARGRVEAHVDVEAENFKGTGRILIARLPGKNPDGFVFISHLCHPQPGANDNASGSALNLELALLFQELISQGELPAPSRTLTFIWVPEMFGSVALAHERPDLMRYLLTGIDLDMVGEDQEKTKGPLIVESEPWSLPCFMCPLLESLTRDLQRAKIFNLPPGWSFKTQEFKGGSDHYVLSDPSIGVPTTMVGHWPDRFYHSSQDTPDKVSAQELAVVGTVCAAAAWLVAWEHGQSSYVVKNLIERAGEKLDNEMKNGASPERMSLLWASKREGGLAYAITREEPYRVVAEVDKGFRRLMESKGVEQLFFTVGGPVYKRRFKAPLFLRTLFAENPEKHWEIMERFRKTPGLAPAMVEAVFLTDGRRSYREILEFLEAEFPGIDPGEYSSLFLALREADLIE